MKQINILLSGLILLGLMFSGYQCSSAELSSAKLYIQQKNWDKAVESLNKEVAKNPKVTKVTICWVLLAKKRRDKNNGREF
ncbi:MAG: hypothetical protein IPG53_20135 [Ignavibacteriales bacterium]|nr:hypothetical protein [Ignavibacteriales bacterium]